MSFPWSESHVATKLDILANVETTFNLKEAADYLGYTYWTTRRKVIAHGGYRHGGTGTKNVYYIIPKSTLDAIKAKDMRRAA
jgi:hypothetical protein